MADGEVADVDHFLHFAFAFRQNFAGLEGDELTKLVFQFAQRISQTPDGVAANWPWRNAPFQKRFLCARDRLVVIISRRGANARQFLSINGRDFVDLRAATTPLTVKDAGVVVGEPEFSPLLS